MKNRLFLFSALISLFLSAVLYHTFQTDVPKNKKDLRILNKNEEEENEELEQENSRRRAEYEWTLQRDPKTGKIPEGIREKEMALLKILPVKADGIFREALTTLSTDVQQTGGAQNSYGAVGPTQNGGRTRAVAYDKRFGSTVNGSVNKVILAGGVNGGIFRTTDGGQKWQFVHPDAEARNISCLAQDPRPGQENTWYAGTGEPIGASAGYPTGYIFGNGILKSTDNGATWTKLSITNVNDPTQFISEWNFIHKIAVHPVTGDVYAAIHRRVVRSRDGGQTWQTVFISFNNIPTLALGGIADLLISSNGSKIIVGMSGRNADPTIAGVFVSTTGDLGTYNRIAGGEVGNPDYVNGWRPYNNAQNAADEFILGWGRIVMALAPSNENILYVMVENTDLASDGKPEADLFKCDMSTPTPTWTNLTNNLVAQRNSNRVGVSTKYIELQGAYNMLLAVHPTNPNIVLAGGVNLFRSTDGFSTRTNVRFIGGLESANTYTDNLGTSHVDFHGYSFEPGNPNRVLLSSDGGIGQIENITATNVFWNFFDATNNLTYNSQFQTLQYYHVGIDPTPGSRNFFGGAQDNSTTFRDRSGIFGDVLPDTSDHYIILGGDGCQVGMTKKNGAGKQFLFCAAQNGQFYRANLPPFSNTDYTLIKPEGSGEGLFVTYFHLDNDNTDLLYYATEDSLFRTNSATTVTPETWTLMDSVHPKVFGDIYALETTKGPYSTFNHLFIGTGAGKVYKIRDPQSPTSSVVDITPPGMAAGAVVRDIAVNPRNQDTLMLVVSNYNVQSIFWTGNATAPAPDWQLIEGNISTPSIRACEIIAKTTGIEYYVGTSIGLFSTKLINGANTVWYREVAPAGTQAAMLNGAIVSSLASRWTDNTLVIGTHGNGMFATGPLGNPVTVVTSVFNPIRNNTNFIKNIYPTITRDVVKFESGNLYTIKKMHLQVTSASGGIVVKKDVPYQTGTTNLGHLPAGTYIITITSSDNKYQTTKKIIKN
ncbi:MAG: hypothetical protein RL642_415 [Bacteroidota bacterium]